MSLLVYIIEWSSQLWDTLSIYKSSYIFPIYSVFLLLLLLFCLPIKLLSLEYVNFNWLSFEWYMFIVSISYYHDIAILTITITLLPLNCIYPCRVLCVPSIIAVLSTPQFLSVNFNWVVHAHSIYVSAISWYCSVDYHFSYYFFSTALIMCIIYWYDLDYFPSLLGS